ncbi:MAG: hypothetical protein LBG11_07675, partial [Bifidobacteriaceae bacterium]|nr:hypothetical protein [Bifidobacteriaceae bacterium]
MLICVAYKWAPDPAEAAVDGAGQLDYSRAKATISEYDAVAIQMARDLANSAGAELVGLTAGPPASAAPLAAKAALSRGLDSLTAVVDESLAQADAARTGQALAGAVRELGSVDLVITGDCSIDEGAGLVPGALAGQLGWPAVLEASKIVVEGSTVKLERAVAGVTELIELAGPAVIGVAAGALAPKAPGMKDVMAAAKKPINRLTGADVGLGRAQGEVLATAKLTGPARKGITIDASDPAAAAADL